MTKILLIEDDSFLQKMYTKKFEVEGYQIEVASDGEEGLAKIRSFKPDMVLLDLMMPKMDGFEVLTQAKADDSIKSIPILVLTNLSSVEDAQTAVSRGALGYLIKSDLTPKEVVAQVQTYLANTTNKTA